MSKNRTIVILSAKRCGSTALYKTLVNHRSIKNCQVGGKSRNWEPAFWYHGWRSLMEMNPSYMRDYFAKNYSYMKIPDVRHRDELFDVWDEVLRCRGPIVLDKSPQYLGNKEALKLLLKYKEERKRDVRIIGLIRDPRDAITSQYVKWNLVQEKKTGIIDSPERREQKWLEKYKNLEFMKNRVPNMLMIRYEDFVLDTYNMVKLICRYCGIQYQTGMDSHIISTNIGRYKTSTNRKIKKWRGHYSEDFQEHLRKYDYV